MKKILAFAVIIVFLYSCNNDNLGKYNTNLPTPKTFMDSISYMIGNDYGNMIRVDSQNVNVDYFVAGMIKGMKNDSNGMFSPSTKQLLQMRFQQIMQQKADSRMKREQEDLLKQGEKNKSAGEKFLAENKNKKGVITTSSGLQYEVIKEGSGAKPVIDDMITIHLKGNVLNGQEIMNSLNGQPIKAPVKNPNFKGFEELFQLMKVGSKLKVYLPPALAFGERGNPPAIPPHTVVVYEVELISIDGKAPTEKNPEQVRKAE